MTDEQRIAEIRVALEREIRLGETFLGTSDVEYLLAALHERDRRIAELEAAIDESRKLNIKLRGDVMNAFNVSLKRGWSRDDLRTRLFYILDNSRIVAASRPEPRTT